MESKELTLVAGGAAVALAVGLGAASWALLPVGRALKAAPQAAFAPAAPSAPLAQMPPTEVPPLGSSTLAAETASPSSSDRAVVAMAETPSAPTAAEAGRDAADNGPRIVHAPPAQRPSEYDRRPSDEGPQPYETWRHYEAREDDSGPDRGPPPPDAGPSYPDDPDGG